MIEMDTRMELRLNALIATKKAIAPSFCATLSECDRACPFYKDENSVCYWMIAVSAIDKLERIMYDYDRVNQQDVKPERSTKEQSRFNDIIV
jgi:hypothetical protein